MIARRTTVPLTRTEFTKCRKSFFPEVYVCFSPPSEHCLPRLPESTCNNQGSNRAWHRKHKLIALHSLIASPRRVTLAGGVVGLALGNVGFGSKADIGEDGTRCSRYELNTRRILARGGERSRPAVLRD